jgi:hypothetical protein
VVPLFGPLMALTIEILFRIKNPGTTPVELESMHFEPDIYWSTFSQVKEEDDDVIPLEEAILINDIKVRRKAVFNTFRGDARNYLDVLMVARNNEDTDTTHYATIQISKIQRDFQLKLQDLAAKFEKDPCNQDLLDEYIELLNIYLQSPLPEKSILRHQQQVFADLLDRKLALMPNDRQALIRKLRNTTTLKEDFDAALALMDQLKQSWPEDEITWIEILRACVEWKDSERCRETVDEIKQQKIRWTKRGREQVRPWVKV